MDIRPSVTAVVPWLRNVFQPVQEAGEEELETNQQLVWIEQTMAVYSNLKCWRKKGVLQGVLTGIDTRGQSSKGITIRISRGMDMTAECIDRNCSQTMNAFVEQM